MNRKKIILGIVALLVVVGLWFTWRVMGSGTRFSQKTKTLYIPEGKATKQYVMQVLKDSGWLKSNGLFNWVAGKTGCWGRLKPGRYEIKKGTSVWALAKKLRNNAQDPVNLVIIKLRTKEEVAKKLGNSFACGYDAVYAALNNNELLKQLGSDTTTYLVNIIPNTYAILWTTPADKLLARLFDESKKFWTEERKQKAAKQGYTPAEIYNIAALVEEETNAEADKGKIARVYMNRLQKNMKLEADPTIKFAIKDFALTRILNKHKDAAAASPYSTYAHTGLPPGPICTPSVKTIDAVLNAAPADYIFFVAQPNFSGLSNFAVDYAEHQQYAAQYHQFLDSLFLARKNKNAAP
ncbi:MAG: endolytic transglycosylase MltG [Dinghuibacter sp.]|nr:endolytic transglycosylase MltG [Dinghuibacter sp.]